MISPIYEGQAVKFQNRFLSTHEETQRNYTLLAAVVFRIKNQWLNHSQAAKPQKILGPHIIECEFSDSLKFDFQIPIMSIWNLVIPP